jgi:hypothetical protein
MNWGELLNMPHATQLARFGPNTSTRPKHQPLTLSEKNGRRWICTG